MQMKSGKICDVFLVLRPLLFETEFKTQLVQYFENEL
jgi:hypothetical protein